MSTRQAPQPGSTTDHAAIQANARHLQKCIAALEQIRAIDGTGHIARIAAAAVRNEPQEVGGTVDG